MSDVVQQETQAAQRGFLVITGAKVWFLITGTILNIGLPRMLGDPARFGDFGVVNTFISIFNMVVIAGGVQVVSKRVSERPGAAAAVRKRTLKLMSWVTIPVCCIILAGADIIARDVFHDASLAGLLRVAVVITLSYGFYAVFIGLLNGLKLFTQQALFDIGFATLKLVLILGAVLSGFSVMGAITGFAAAAAIIAMVAFVVTRSVATQTSGLGPVPSPEVPVSDVAIGGFMLQVMGYTLMINVLLQGDVLVLKSASNFPVGTSFTSGAGSNQLAILGSTMNVPIDALVEPATTAATAVLSGLYRATKNVSLISYQAVIAITFVIFPLVSRSTFQSDGDATSRYVRQTVRVAALLVAFVATMLAAGGEPLLALLFGDAYRVAAPALTPMLAGMACFALLFVNINILSASGRPYDAFVLAGVAAVAQLTALYFIITGSRGGHEILLYAALVTLVAIAVALVVSAWLLRSKLRVSLPWLNLGRILLAAAVSLGAATLTGTLSVAASGGIVGIFVRVCAALVVFVAMLFATRELTRHDLTKTLSSALRRG